ncbi:MAG TPA: prolyl oligopeptidase family serine peptidase [Candidatus Dormibacteraeota bacterium]|nr:prolyl oligopeptidase family serine peptidase [Candidatus Dormibacteraeota bacterium]
MSEKAALPCGSWPSPITSELITSAVIRLGWVTVDSADVLWTEGRPQEGGRSVLVRRAPDGAVADLTPAPLNVRSRVHEYGGLCHAAHGGSVWFSDFRTARLHRLDAGGVATPITPEGDLRYADMVVDARRDRLVCILEDHTTGAREAVNAIGAVPLGGGAPVVLAGGHDFAAAPRISPDGARLAWLTWDHPSMPWDATDLWVAELDAAGVPGAPVHVAGGPGEAVIEPSWAPDGSLWFASDAEDGWWNLHRWDATAGARRVTGDRGEFGAPAWNVGRQGYAFLAGGGAAATVRGTGRSGLVVVDAGGEIRDVETPFTEWGSIVSRGRSVLGVAASPVLAPAVVEVDVDSGAVTVLRHSSSLDVDARYVSAPRAVEFPTTGDRTAHALYYAPRNPVAEAPDGEPPPLRVLTHGGPTASASSALNLEVQYFTSRGFAVVDVDYGGSTGYGRAYRERLNDMWGIVDVDDAVAAVRFLVEGGLADPRRVTICGGSAGGYTTLRALTTTDVFGAGCSLYGVGDLGALARDTHKFESRYLDTLVGPYPERRDLYDERSPINHTDSLASPVILFQGLEDAVVPPAQSERFFEAARAKGLPCAYVAFPGEQHGFRIAANIRRSLDGELYFYARVFGFDLADDVEPIEIVNPAR